MNIPQMRLQSIDTLTSIRTLHGKAEMEQPSADIDIQQPKADMEIERTPSTLTIDQYEARADVDMKSVKRRAEDFANQGKEDWLEGLARVSADGDELMRVEDGGDPIVELSRRNSQSPVYDVNVGFVPSAGSVKVDYNPGSVRVIFNPQRVINNTRVNHPITNIMPNKVEVSLKQYAALKIEWIMPGSNFSKEI
ncbi:DUF6470 family protein [Rossellomorea marisflavi]|uniref:DUF6470 family protein n=1 Tax=Rossellomorea marisflavi TaxID=189381 RepID=UPI0034578840